ncbi:helicase-related protein [Dactylosporangium sp. NPDC000244]|uniref:helicase-related protein n=1 Tax=Dactylosporangium sp. NPDC000244 TaxID=3154365 RepID=UPI00332F9230
MKRYDAQDVIAGLKDFQRATVDHVIERYFGADPTRRFLVADETGLGKSVVARGVIAKTLERLQDDPSVKRVDVVYVCSNQDVAKQNIDRLRVTPDEAVTLSTRLTLLAKEVDKLTSGQPTHGKPINLVAFTPGTSFDQGWRTGAKEERALIFLLLEEAERWDGWRSRSAIRALQGSVSSPERFQQQCRQLETALNGQLDRTIARQFIRLAKKDGLLKEFNALLDEVGRRAALPDALRERSRRLIGDLRAVLARAGVDALEPDLIILDEFQRFRELLDPNGGPAADLAKSLFDYGDARVLLLSATPYKPFTYAEERAAGEDHYADFRQILGFLNPDDQWHTEVAKTFEAHREALVHAEPSEAIRADLRELLLRVMCRTERPALKQAEMLHENIVTVHNLAADDLRSYAAMRRIAKAVEAPVTIEYWKSAPYFLNFLDGYQIGEKVRAALKGRRAAEIQPLLASAQLLDAEAVIQRRAIDLGNARLRHLAADTLDRGWWQLLWLPPSMPYSTLGEPFASAAAHGITKRLLFSSWNATPTAVAGLLSYEAERRIEDARGPRVEPPRRRSRLDYRLDGERAASMSTLAMFWPHPGLAQACDPLAIARRRPTETLPLEAIEAEVRERLSRDAPAEFSDPRHVGEVQPWHAVFRWPGARAGIEEYSPADAAGNLGSAHNEDGTPTGLDRHVSQAYEVITAAEHPVAREVSAVIDDLTAIGLHGPGNIAWRALARLITPDSKVTPECHWDSAACIADGLQSLFNRTDAAQLLDHLQPGVVYWRAVLRYCAAGGLQAVLDEHLHVLRSASPDLPLDDESLYALSLRVFETLTVQPVTYRAFNPHQPDKPIGLPGRFALRYGGRGEEQAQVERKIAVRQAFNSPFWPFVVATTSAGQEGIDFHQWCSAVVHWNTPPNPVDFEQREGRVHRFGGHAVRRNIAEHNRAAALSSDERDVWKSAYDAARTDSGALGDFAPYWVYGGKAKIERHVLPYPLSRDEARLERLKADLAHYRLAFGQPRQEDLLALLRRTAKDGTPPPDALDLRPYGSGC